MPRVSEDSLYESLVEEVQASEHLSVTITRRECRGCGEDFNELDMTELGGEYFCSGCINNWQLCDDCGGIMHDDDSTYISFNDQTVCDSCRQDYSYCDFCEEYFSEDLAEVHNQRGSSDYACEQCIENNDYIHRCYSCGNYYYDNDSTNENRCYTCRTSIGQGTIARPIVDIGDSAKGTVCRNTRGIKQLGTSVEIPMSQSIKEYLNSFYGYNHGFEYVYNPDVIINHKQNISIKSENRIINTFWDIVRNINSSQFEANFSNEEMLKQIGLVPYKFYGMTIANENEGTITYLPNQKGIDSRAAGKQKEISVFKFIEYTVDWFEKLIAKVKELGPEFSIMYMEDWIDNLKAAMKEFKNPNSYELEMSNDQDVKLKLWNDSYSMCRTCQNPSNKEGLAKGFHELFTNGCNGLLILYKNNTPVGRVLFRLFYAYKTENKKPYIFLDRPYITVGRKENVLKAIVEQLSVDYDVIVGDKTIHDNASNWSYLNSVGVKMTKLNIMPLQQPAIKLDKIYHAYYQDSRTHTIQLEDYLVTTVAGLDGNIYLVNKNKDGN